LTRLGNQGIQEIETRELRPAGIPRRAFDLLIHANAALCLFLGLFLLVVALVKLKRPLRRGTESKWESVAAGRAACKSL
jgi:hypothetical protein